MLPNLFSQNWTPEYKNTDFQAMSKANVISFRSKHLQYFNGQFNQVFPSCQMLPQVMGIQNQGGPICNYKKSPSTTISSSSVLSINLPQQQQGVCNSFNSICPTDLLQLQLQKSEISPYCDSLQQFGQRNHFSQYTGPQISFQNNNLISFANLNAINQHEQMIRNSMEKIALHNNLQMLQQNQGVSLEVSSLPLNIYNKGYPSLVPQNSEQQYDNPELVRIDVKNLQREAQQNKRNEEISAWIEKRRGKLLKEIENFNSQEVILETPQLKTKEIQKKRGSQYRGVSKNGLNWQVQIMGKFTKRYIGCVGYEEGAARIYDYFAIFQKGLKSKTNFRYTKAEILKISEIFSLDDIIKPSKKRFHSCLIRLGSKSSQE